VARIEVHVTGERQNDASRLDPRGLLDLLETDQEVALPLLALGGLPPGFVGPGALFIRPPGSGNLLVGLALLCGSLLLGGLLLLSDRLRFRFRAGA
jgi:hypothetical protein